MTEITDKRDVKAGGTDSAYGYRRDPAVPAFADDHPLIVYDGNCRLCSGVVQFVLRHDRGGVFRFAAAQSPLGTALYRHYGLEAVRYDTYLVLERGRMYLKSAAAWRLAAGLGLPWSILSLGRAVPRAWADRLYDFVARRRLRWFGATRTCFLQDPGHAERFLG